MTNFQKFRFYVTFPNTLHSVWPLADLVFSNRIFLFRVSPLILDRRLMPQSVQRLRHTQSSSAIRLCSDLPVSFVSLIVLVGGVFSASFVSRYTLAFYKW